MTQTHPGPATGQPPHDGSAHPGWQWDPVRNRWVAQQPAFRPPTQGPPVQGPPVQGPPVQGPPVQGPPVQRPYVPGPPGRPYQGPPAQTWQQPAAPVLPGPTPGMHLKRAVDWNVSEVVVSPRERAQLQACGVVEPRMQALLCWRRSSLLVVLPVLLTSVVLSFIEAGTTDTAGFTDFGKIWLWIPSVALLLIPIGALGVINSWTELRRSSKLLIRCWIASITLPLLAALLPIEAILDVGSLRAQATTQEELAQIEAVIFTGRLTLAVSYALTLLPVIISVPGGVLKGAGRVKTLFPASVLPGWFLISVAPFYSLFMIVVFVLIDQIIGHVLLVLGIGLLAFAPWLFLINRKTYARPMSIQEAHVELARIGRTGGWVTLTGFALVAIYLLSAKVQGLDVVGSDSDTSVFTYVQVGRTSLEVMARSTVTAVVFCLIFLSMVYAEWRTAQTVAPEVRAEHDREMNALRRYEEAQPPVSS